MGGRRQTSGEWAWVVFLTGILLVAFWIRDGIFDWAADIRTAHETDSVGSVLPSGGDGVGAEEVRAVWITQYDQAHWLVDGDRPRDAAEFRRMVRQAARSVASAGLNTVFLQVRPFGDSFYPSALYPPSQMAVVARKSAGRLPVTRWRLCERKKWGTPR